MTLDYSVRGYTGGAAVTNLSVGMSSVDVTATLASAAGWPTANFAMVVDVGTVNEEKMFVGSRTGTALSSITRAIDGTSAVAHQAGGTNTVRHIYTAQDAIEANAIAAALTTKGDLLVKGATPSVAPARLAVGADNTLLVADTAQSLGLKYSVLNNLAMFASPTLPPSIGTSNPGSPVQGQLSMRTDEGRLYVYDSAAWQRYAHYTTAGRTCVRLRRAANQTTGAATTADLSWDTEDQDTDNWIAVTATTLTVPSGLGGVYGGIVTISFTTGANIMEILAVQGGVTRYLPLVDRAPVYAGEWPLVPRFMAAGTTLKIQVNNTGGTTATWTASLELYRMGL